jgi:hypothetical protein
MYNEDGRASAYYMWLHEESVARRAEALVLAQTKPESEAECAQFELEARFAASTRAPTARKTAMNFTQLLAASWAALAWATPRACSATSTRFVRPGRPRYRPNGRAGNCGKHMMIVPGTSLAGLVSLGAGKSIKGHL